MQTLKRNTRLDADVKTQYFVEMPTLTASTGNRTGECDGDWIDITSHFLGSIINKGESISPLSTFFYASGANIYRRRLPHAFLSALDHEFERFGYLNTLSSKSLDIPFLNCSILPESSFTSDLFRTSTNVITSAVHFYLRSSYRGRSARLARASISTAGVRGFVLHHIVWTIFIPLISTFREIWFYPYHISCRISSVPVNE
jgi:hypothetical protein